MRKLSLAATSGLEDHSALGKVIQAEQTAIDAFHQRSGRRERRREFGILGQQRHAAALVGSAFAAVAA